MKANILLFIIIFSFGSLSAQWNRDYRNPSHPSYSDPYDDPYEDEPPYYPDHRYKRQRIQLALILDVSGSMNGLLHQAQSQLWNVINTLSYDGNYPPILEIALFEYGNKRRGYNHVYLRKLMPFSQDVDWLSERLFQMRIGGNREYSGAAIQAAVHELDWSRSSRDIKLIFIAGNESFSQGPVPFRRAISQARRKGISVNTIFCGDFRKGVSLGWQEAARMGGGDYMSINHNHHMSYVPNRYDRQLHQLNNQLNQTYIPYGHQGRSYQQRQWKQDEYARNMGMGHHSQRTLTKASTRYQNPNWDLIDGLATGKVKLERIPASELPPEMRNMNMNERKRYLSRKKAEREKIQQEIITLSKKREPIVRHESKSVQHTKSPRRPQTLDKAIIESVQHQREKQTEVKTPVRKPISRNETRNTTPQKSESTQKSEVKKAEPNKARSPRRNMPSVPERYRRK